MCVPQGSLEKARHDLFLRVNIFTRQRDQGWLRSGDATLKGNECKNQSFLSSYCGNKNTLLYLGKFVIQISYNASHSLALSS